MTKTSATRKAQNRTVDFSTETIYRKDENGEFLPIEAGIIDENYYSDGDQDETVDINFEKIWLATVMEALEQVGNKKMKVASFILNKRDKSTNYLIKTQREIAKECKVSIQTVSSTLKALEKAGMLVGKSGIYQINPDMLAKGSHNKRMAILRIYTQNKNSKPSQNEE